MYWANLRPVPRALPVLLTDQELSMYCQMDPISHSVPKSNVALRTMHKRKCFIRRHTHHNILLAVISARLKLKDIRAIFVGTREEEKKNQTKPALEMAFARPVKTLWEIWMHHTKGICVSFMALAALFILRPKMTWNYFWWQLKCKTTHLV